MNSLRICLVLAIVRVVELVILPHSAAFAADDQLVGHWPLVEDARDVSGMENHGTAHGVRFTRDGAVFNGHLYVGVSRVLLHYSGLEPTLAHHIGGKVFRYENGKWIDLGQLLGLDGVNGMAVFRGKLYVTGFYQPGLFRYEGGTQWTPLGSPGGMRPEGLIVHNGALFASGYDEGAVYRFDGTHWTHTGLLGDSTQVYGQGIYQGRLMAGTWPSGTVYRHEGDRQWVSTGRLGQAEEVMGPNVYNDASLRIGLGQHDYFNGMLRDVRIYKKSLSAAEVAALAAAR